VIDELLDRPDQSLGKIKYDPAGREAKGSKYTILSTRTDNFDRGKAKSNCEDAIAAYPDLACVVGLFAYNTPMCLEALKTANKLGRIKVAAFDEADATLDGIADGYVQGTVSQQPNLYGYHSIRILAALARGDQSVLPEDQFLEVPIVLVRKDNVASFRDKLNKLREE
jgi:ribose transport system substrate-binding protein